MILLLESFIQKSNFSNMSNSIKHLLVIRSSAMGDVAMTIPVLLAFRESFPNVKITVLTKVFFTPFFEKIPNLEVKFFETETTHKGILGIQNLAKELKLEAVDAIADLHNVLRTNILKNLLWFSGIPFKQIDKGRTEKKALTSWEEKVFKPLKSTHQRYVDVLRSLGFDFDFSQKKHFLQKEPIPLEIQSLIGYNTQKWIGIAPFAQHEGKVYSLELLTKVIDGLNQTKHYKIVLFGGGTEEVQKLKTLENTFEQVLSVAGRLDLSQELNLISNLDLMLSMDSSNGHIAAMYGIPVITIWGVTHPYTGFTPYGQTEENSITPNLTTYPKIPTSVYGNKVPAGYKNAINSISPQTIINKIADLTQ